MVSQKGIWNSNVRRKHVNNVELSAVLNFVLTVFNHILVHLGNVVMVICLNFQGGTRSNGTLSLVQKFTQGGSCMISLIESNPFGRQAQQCSRYTIKPRGGSIYIQSWCPRCLAAPSQTSLPVLQCHFSLFFFFPETEQDSLLDEDVIQKCRKLVNTRSPSIQTFHGIKWKLFCKWYACLHRDPLHCPVLKVPNISAGIARQGQISIYT